MPDPLGPDEKLGTRKTANTAARPWAILRPALKVAVLLAVVMLIPTVVAYGAFDASVAAVTGHRRCRDAGRWGHRRGGGVPRASPERALAGAVLALVLVWVLPDWAALVAGGALLVLIVAYAALGRYAQEVLFLTPFIVLLGSSGAAAGTAELAAQRIMATLLGAVLAGVIALALARADRQDDVVVEQPGASDDTTSR